MAGWTNRGKKMVLDYYFRRQGSLPAMFYMALCTAAVTPGPGTNVLGDLQEIPAGNGYVSGGVARSPALGPFPDLQEDDVNNKAVLTMAQFGWQATGGPIPASGTGARYLVMTDDNPTIANRQVLCYWDLGGNYFVSAPQNFIMNLVKIEAVE